jgi:quercetin dioxygenase-like cupin family protein
MIVEFIDECGPFYFRSILIELPGERIAQHVHDYDHATLCGSGKARMYVDGVETGILEAGQAVMVKANHQHEFESLEKNTRLTCVHDPRSAESIKGKGL